jgi:hypothetical protein
MACAKLRIQNLTDVFAAAYLLTLLMGIKNRHPWIGKDTFTLTYCDICGIRLTGIRDAAKKIDMGYSNVLNHWRNCFTKLFSPIAEGRPEVNDGDKFRNRKISVVFNSGKAILLSRIIYSLPTNP